VATLATLKCGASGALVRRLQQALNATGFRVAVDGDFGASTEAAVKRLQKAHGLTCDGQAGPQTWQVLGVHDDRASAGGATPGLSPRGAAFVGHFEGFRPQLYNDPVGHCTIGYGHLVHHGPINGSEPAEFKRGITSQRGLELLMADAGDAAEAVHTLVKVPLRQTQSDALIDFVFNLGAGAFTSSTLLKTVNAGGFAAVPAQLNRWTLAGGRPLPGLVRRRAAEGRLFTDGVYVA
jgi:lysozyme